MFYLILHFVFGSLIILIIWLYLHSTKKSKSYSFKRIAPLISMILVVGMAWFSIILNIEMKEESARKPDLKLVANEWSYKNDKTVLRSIMLINDGDIEATILDVYLVFPVETDIKLFSDVFFKYKTENSKVFYKYDRLVDSDANKVTSNGGSVLINTYGVLELDKDMQQLEYEIAYTSRYDSGLKKGFFEIK